jgi:hypothetical protein
MVVKYVCLLNAVKIQSGTVSELLALVESGWRSARGHKGEMPKAIQIQTDTEVFVLFDCSVAAYIASEEPSVSAESQPT